MWAKVIALTSQKDERGNAIPGTGTAEYGDRVFAALDLDQYLADFKDMEGITLEEWEDLKVVRAQKQLIEEDARYEASKQKAT